MRDLFYDMAGRVLLAAGLLLMFAGTILAANANPDRDSSIQADTAGSHKRLGNCLILAGALAGSIGPFFWLLGDGVTRASSRRGQ
jgi:hypothetical protein